MVQRRVFITGAGRGLGHELAAQLLAEGHTVWGSTRTGECDLELAGCVPMELADETSIIEGAAAIGLDAIDVLINCAGIDSRATPANPQDRGTFGVDSDTLLAVMAVNVAAPMVLTRELLPRLRAGDDPLVLNISSQLGSMQTAHAIGADTPYCVSKAALNMLSIRSVEPLRADGIAVVMLHPGWVQTDMGGPNANLTMAESASAICSTLANLTLTDTGRFITWDGNDHPW